MSQWRRVRDESGAEFSTKRQVETFVDLDEPATDRFGKPLPSKSAEQAAADRPSRPSKKPSD